MSCFGGAEEQLYLVELLVETVEPDTKKFKDVARGHGDADRPLVVKIRFLDFPTFEISQRDFYFSTIDGPNANGCLDYHAGRACLFVKQPRDLVRDMQTKPLKIGIFPIGDTYPIAETTIELSGCLCNQISMSSNDSDHLPPPYLLHGAYRLNDPGENPWGTINLDLRLGCFGKSVTTHYQIDRKTLCFKNDRDDDRYYVKRFVPVEFCGDEVGKDTMKCGDSMLPSDSANVESEGTSADAKQPETEKIVGIGKKKTDGTKKSKNKKKK